MLPATILIVDNEEINRRLLKAILKTSPYESWKLAKRPKRWRCCNRNESTW